MNDFKQIIKEVTKKEVKNFCSWDLAKVIVKQKEGVLLNFYVCHKDEIETEEIIELHNLGKSLIKGLASLNGAKIEPKGIFLKGYTIEQVEDLVLEACQEEYKEFWGEESDNPYYDFSISVEY